MPSYQSVDGHALGRAAKRAGFALECQHLPTLVLNQRKQRKTVSQAQKFAL
jgi:hypothetical protein